MNRAFLIARQEFIKFVTRRGFLFTLIGVPLWIALAVLLPPLLAHSNGHVRFTVIDRGGGRLGDILVQAAAQEREKFIVTGPSAALTNASAGRFAAVADKALSGRDLDAIVVIPKDFDATHPAQLWSKHDQKALQAFVQASLTDALRLRALNRLGDAQTVLKVRAAVEARTPETSKAAANKGLLIAISIGAAILLLVVAMMNSTALLQGVIEEKSTRMIEVLLSSATPWEIVTGKIVGVVAVALFTVLLWVGSAILLGTMFAGNAIGGLVFAVLHILANPVLLALILVYFLCGLLIYGAIFLSIGSMSASLADAQAYLGPSMMIIMLPNLFIAGIINDPNGTLAVAASYFPIYTPYIMLMRITSDPPAIEIVTTLLLAVCLTVFLVWRAGSIFARHALTTEKPPSLKRLFGRT
ncbi:MAG: ABC transporter permease [Rhizomicrobium sp.]